MKLGKRLKQIDSMVIESAYNHIWDCCCDHGFLGMNLLNRKAAPHIHFVDIVPDLINPLTDQLKQFFPRSKIQPNAWHTHCLDCTQLPLHQYSGKQLVIIAGVGGDLTIQIVEEICEKHPNLEIDFLLCPIRQLYDLRQTLINLNMGLISEYLIKENRHFYEILLLSHSNNLANPNKANLNKTDPIMKSVSPAGDDIWSGNTQEEKQVAKEYLDKTLNHYQRMQQGLNSPEMDLIVQAYKQIDLSK